jgi:hypothetical protein
LYTLNLGCSFITLREPFNNQRPRHCMASCCTLYKIRFVDCCFSCCTFFFLVIVLSDRLRYMDSDYPCGIFLIWLFCFITLREPFNNQRPRYCMASCCTLFKIRFVDCCLSFSTFSFGHCVVWSSSIYRFWLLLWYLLDMTVLFILNLLIDKININLYL